MTRTRRKPDPVRSSATDPVDAWLDMLVAMLSIPRPDRQRVRDELEDHLRSRIDDLLIHGLTEPQALEKAVAELGETADLARQMSHAHRAPRTRRTVMHTALIAAAGGAIVFGASQFGSAPHAPAPHGAVAAAHDEEKQKEILIPVRDTTFGELMNIAREHSPKPLLVHWPMLEEIGITPDTPVGLDADPLPLHVVHQLLIEMTGRYGNPIAMQETDDLFEISTRSHFDRRTTSRVAYDIGESDIRSVDVIDALLSHIEPDAWREQGGDLAAVSVLNSSLVVTAPERIQNEIGTMLAELYTNRRSQVDSSRRSIQQRISVIEGEEIGALEYDYARLREAWHSLTSSIAEQRVWLDTMPADVTREDLTQAHTRLEIEQFERAEIVKSMDSIRARIQSARARIAELQESAAALP